MGVARQKEERQRLKNRKRRGCVKGEREGTEEKLCKRRKRDGTEERLKKRRERERERERDKAEIEEHKKENLRARMGEFQRKNKNNNQSKFHGSEHMSFT